MEALELGLDLTPAEAAERVIPADPDAIDPAASPCATTTPPTAAIATSMPHSRAARRTATS